MSIDKKRRDFSGMLLGGVALVGAAGVGYGVKASWDPLPSVMSAGFTTVDISKAQVNKLYVVEWRGKPIFILNKGKSIVENKLREFIANGNVYSVMVGLCTHLGCIPAYVEKDKIFKCACHGGEFDGNGIQTFGPPPSPLEIPPFKMSGNMITLGEKGEEYNKLTSNKA
jgi:ubiquinol-cytochrome c reductase iron-sulfur subunit